MSAGFRFISIIFSLVISSATFLYSPAIAKTQLTSSAIQEVDREMVKELLATFEQAERAMQSHDLDGIMDLYADDYGYHGLKKSDIKAIWSKLFQHYKELESVHTFSVIRKGGLVGKLSVEITCTGVIWGTSKQTSLRTPIDSWYEEIHFLRKENDRWRILGHAGGEIQPVMQFGIAPHPLF